MMQRLSLLLPLVLIAAVAAVTQPPLRMFSSTPSCATCRIEFEDVAHMRLPSDSLSFSQGDRTKIAQVAGGRFLAIGLNETPAPAVFNAQGQFERLIGRRGSGPGEFLEPSEIIFGAADTVWIADGNKRHVFSPDLRWVRSETARQMGSAVRSPNGNVVFNARISSPERAGLPLHIIRTDGTITRSFGVQDPVMDPRTKLAGGEDPISSLSRILVAGESSTFWTNSPGKFLLEQYDYDGNLVQQVRHQLDGWYADATKAWPSEAAFNGRALYMAVPSRHSGLLWLTYVVRNTNYRKPDSLFQPTRAQSFRAVDMVVEAFDTRNARVLASRRLPVSAAHKMIGSPDLIAFFEAEDPDYAFPSYRIRRAVLVR